MHPVDLISAAEYSRSRIHHHAVQRRLVAQPGSAPRSGFAAGPRHRLGLALVLLGTRIHGAHGMPEPAPLTDPAAGPSHL